MEFTIHNSYVILGLVSSTVIYFSAQLLTHEVLTQGYVAPRLKSSIHKVSFPFYVELFFFLSSTRLLPDLNIWITRQVSHKKQELPSYPSQAPGFKPPPRFLWDPCCPLLYCSMLCFSSFCLVSNLACVSQSTLVLGRGVRVVVVNFVLRIIILVT